MGKQQNTAARDGAPTDAQRAAELLNVPGENRVTIKLLFENHRLSNDLRHQRGQLSTEVAAKLLKNPLPYFDGRLNFIADANLYVSNSKWDEELLGVEKCFDSDSQSRQVTAIVQAFGCGKTRAALQLHQYFIVLPIRVSKSHELIKRVTDLQKQLYDRLDRPNSEQIQQFSSACFRLVELALLALVALFHHCVATNIIECHKRDRFDLAVLLLGSTGGLIRLNTGEKALMANPLHLWASAWFDEHLHAALSGDTDFGELRNRLLQMDAKMPQVPFVFLLDEVHELMEVNRGFVLHRQKTGESIEVAVERWRQEQAPVDDQVKRERTDMLYQFRRVMVDYLDNPLRRCAFVMCTTAFRAWNEIRELTTPYSRIQVNRIWKLPVIDEDNVKQCIQHYFNVEDAVFDHPMLETLGRFRRPLFMTLLLGELSKTFSNCVDLSKHTLTQWINNAARLAEGLARVMAMPKIDSLADARYPQIIDKNHTSCFLIDFVYSKIKQNAGSFAVNGKALIDLIDVGIVRLDRFDKLEPVNSESGLVSVADPIFEDALVEFYKQRQPVAVVLKSLMMRGLEYKTARESTLEKGTVGEHVLACLALNGALEAAVYHETPKRKMILAPEAGAVAGEKKEIVQHYRLQGSTESELIWLIWRKHTELPCILFPSILSGPDLLFRSRNGGGRVIAIQAKMAKRYIAPTAFTEALTSLNPAQFYMKSKKEKDNEAGKNKLKVKLTANREHWMRELHALRDFEYHRVVFVALGFSPKVQYLVREYNQKQANSSGRKRTYIHLLSLDDVKTQLGDDVYDTLYAACEREKRKPNIQGSIVLQSEWKQMRSTSESLPPSFDDERLRTMCKMRSLSVTGSSTQQLIEKLDGYDVAADLAKCNWDINLSL